MDIIIRKEEVKDYPVVFDVIQKAFENEEMSDYQEHFLVDKLRNADSFVPELSLVAEVNGEIVGYVLLTEIDILNEATQFVNKSLALAPVAVLSNYQNQGIGSALIRASHDKARELGYKSVVVLGHADYYPKFGYKQADSFGISMPFEVPSDNSMALELCSNGLTGVNGMVIYPTAFFE